MASSKLASLQDWSFRFKQNKSSQLQRRKEIHEAGGTQADLGIQVMSVTSGTETCQDAGETKDDSQTVPWPLLLLTKSVDTYKSRTNH